MMSLSLIFIKGLVIIFFIKFIIIFSSNISISLKVNLNVSKTWFSYIISKDKQIPKTLVRNFTILEEFGRISYIFRDKTGGTFARNEMIFKNIELQSQILGEEIFED